MNNKKNKNKLSQNGRKIEPWSLTKSDLTNVFAITDHFWKQTFFDQKIVLSAELFYLCKSFFLGQTCIFSLLKYVFKILHVYLDLLACYKISHWNSGGPSLNYLPVCGTDHRMAVVGFPPKLGTGTFMTGKTFPLLVQSFWQGDILQCCKLFL